MNRNGFRTYRLSVFSSGHGARPGFGGPCERCFPGSFVCPVQEAVGARLIQAFERGRVMVHIPAFCSDQFTHPKATRAASACSYQLLPVATSALGLSFQDAVAIRLGTPSSPDRDGQWL